MITIGMCTYRRPGAVETLSSLARQILPAGQTMEIVVVDNDGEGSGRATIMGWSAETGVPVRYFVEPGPNISAARNRILAEARGEWLAMIDDDEIADPDWLLRLFEAAGRYAADAVLGRVVAQYPAEAPAWMVKADPLSRDWGPTGTRKDMGSTANALVRLDTVRAAGVRFDLRLGRTGGEDSDFFGRLAANGARIVVCREAVVRESIPLDRLRAEYLRARAVRSGQSYGMIRLRALRPARRALFLLGSTGKALAFLGCAGALRLARPDSAWRVRTRAWLNLGKVRACLNLPVYKLY